MPPSDVTSSATSVPQFIAAVLARRGIVVNDAHFSKQPSPESFRDAEHLHSRALQLLSAGRVQEAIDSGIQSALKFPFWSTPYHTIGYAFSSLDDLPTAIDFFRASVQLDPYSLSTQENLAIALLESGSASSALDASLELEKYIPGTQNNHFRIGTLCLQNGEYREAEKWLDSGLNSLIITDSSRILPHGVVTVPRLKHDIMQLEYLIDREILPGWYRNVLGAYQHVLSASPYSETPHSWSVEQEFQLNPDQISYIRPFYRRVLHIADAPALPDGALNRCRDFKRVQEDYYSRPAPYSMVVLDDFLTPEALQLILNYCLESTIWHNDAQQGRNYIGAYHGSGFACPLVQQIAEETQVLMPRIFGEEKLEQVWAYRNVMGSSGIGTHADFAAVNLNLYITPDSANLDPSSGGLVVYDRAAPSDWSFEDFNSDVEQIAQAVAGAERVRIPYRQNRAIIFNSSVFHESDSINFGTSYGHRRTNVTLLFGSRGK